MYVKDKDRGYDIEMNTYHEEDIWLRTRYYQSLLDADCLLRGETYTNLKESYILFISRHDPFGKAIPQYTALQTVREDNSVAIGDKTHKVVYNASAYDKAEDEKIRAFLRYVYENTPGDSFTDSIKGRVAELKEDELFKGDYARVNLHDFDIMREAREEGAHETKLQSALNLLAMNLGTTEQIAQAVNLPIDEVLSLAKEQNSSIAVNANS